MKRKMINILMIAIFAAVFSVCELNAQVVVKVKPVRTKMVVIKTKCPGKNHIWIAGHWKWSARQNKYVWIDGRWVRKRAGKTWIAGHWKKVPGGWKYIPGHWA